MEATESNRLQHLNNTRIVFIDAIRMRDLMDVRQFQAVVYVRRSKKIREQ